MPLSEYACPPMKNPETGEYEDHPATVTRPGHYEALTAAAKKLDITTHQLPEEVDHVDPNGEHGYGHPEDGAPSHRSEDESPDNKE